MVLMFGITCKNVKTEDRYLALIVDKDSFKDFHSARYITFKLCCSCPYQSEYIETLNNMGSLTVKLE
jgi:hypothetical protein